MSTASFGGTACIVPSVPTLPFALSYLDALPKGVDKLGKKCFDNIEVLRQVDKGVDDSIAVPSRPPLDAFDQPIICIERSV